MSQMTEAQSTEDAGAEAGKGPFSTIEEAISSRWRSQSALASGPSTTLL